jgi:carbonic anhydrase/acetyltransferase-like protein (isoleucine patch superfamily)
MILRLALLLAALVLGSCSSMQRELSDDEWCKSSIDRAMAEYVECRQRIDRQRARAAEAT